MEQLRPTYHFMPEQNWMNDPNGVCYYQGAYHLFYQYNPNGSQWGDIHWGHAKSTDFLHWEHLPMALTPSTELGELHCFSGCAVVSEDKPLLFYTSVGEGSRNAELGAEQWMAIGDESFTHFEKYTKNPLLTKDDHGNLTVTDWRDPFVVKKDDRFYMVLGATVDQHGCALLYHSDDLIHWEFLQILAEGSADERIWECPNLLFFGDTCVLAISPGDTPRYLMGKLTPEHTLSIESEGMLDHCGMEGFYAPNSFLDSEGRTIMIGWITENSRKEMGKDLKWSGAQSIPRILSIENQTLHMTPLPELQALRQQEETYTNLVCSTRTTLPFQTRSRAFEMELNLHLDPDSLLTIDLLASSHPSPEEKTTIIIDAKTNTIQIDRSHSSLDTHCSKSPLQAAIPTAADNHHEIRIFADHSILEIFVDTQTALTTRIYPTQETSDHITLFATQTQITKATLWELDPLTYQ